MIVGARHMQADAASAPPMAKNGASVAASSGG